MSMHAYAVFITAVLASDRSTFFGGAKAQTVEFEGVRLQSVVRSLRTTDCKRTGSNSTMRTFAPPKKMQRSDFRCAAIKIASPYRHMRAYIHVLKSSMPAHACSSSRRVIFSGGAKTPTTELEGVRFQSVM